MPYLYRMFAELADKITLKLLQLLPARRMGRFIYRLSRSERPWLKDRFIRWFCKWYRVNTHEAEKAVPSGYRNFNEFFTRKLQHGVRPLDERPDSLLCPADGTLAQAGYARDGAMVQAKGLTYRLEALLGDGQFAGELADCAYATIYLAPYNYHRIHMPVAGRLELMRFVPGLLHSVNAVTTANVPNLYAINERLVCQFRGTEGPFAMVLVGAMNVASISTAWAGEILPDASRQIVTTEYAAAEAPALERGEYMGHFNMGSTVVLIGPGAALRWADKLTVGDTVRVGERLGSLSGNT